ncbi:ABC transporter substrate-binding protein [Acuticoccus sediminis]|uniref:ABC transporter substrate-binding protein n=1 Tax=Acuticoccus sediminis TaxID=2184697 RepID=A0A8B2P3C2_9HYPH|nr:acyclic terpene utilization AtuA family protein [Acuticoccus sediminis]RAI03632.1 ABC transporter substrate-binding protein [Acuticoccus sediminis]
MTRTVRLGAGAGFSGDRIDPAVELAEKGRLDYLVFECLAERTIALAQQARLGDIEGGFDPLLEARMRAVLPACAAGNVRIVTNMGAANPVAAASRVRAIARELGLNPVVAAVTGDDVLDVLRRADPMLEELAAPLSSLGDAVISANAYLGAGPIAEALGAGADIVVTGRAADPALFLGPLVHEFGWAMDDWTRLGRGTVAGHLLECAAQITGGYFADPGRKDVPDLARIGFPIGEVDADGGLTIGKVAGSGGRIDAATVTEQLLYEVHDPAAYLQPDVAADFSAVTVREAGPDLVRVEGGDGRARSGLYKVSVGYRDGFIGEGQISYAGTGAEARGRLALEILRERMALTGIACREVRGELIGVNSVFEGAAARGEPAEVRVRFAARTDDREAAARIGQEVEALYLCGPAGGGGVTRGVREVLAIASALVPENDVAPRVTVVN